MNFKGNYRKIGDLDVSALKSKALELTEDDWAENAHRQKSFKAHRNTKSIPLIFDEDFRHSNPTIRPMFERFEAELAPIYRAVRETFDEANEAGRLQTKVGSCYAIRTLLARLDPGGFIDPHMDRNFSLTHAHRIHVPIKTHADVEFSVGGEAKNLSQGEIWEINNRRMHAVKNRSPIDRIHLIIDWVIPGERCCCSKHTHPLTPCSPKACIETDYALEPCGCLA